MNFQTVRVTLIYFTGVVSGSLLFSAVNNCDPLCGSSAGVYALFGAAIVKIKRQSKYRGFNRQLCNGFIILITTSFVAFDLGYALYTWVTCKEATASTAISAHASGLIAGLCVGYWVLNKFEESWGTAMMTEADERRGVKEQQLLEEQTYCWNCKNFKEAYLHNPDVVKLCKSKFAWCCLILLSILWTACIAVNIYYSTLPTARCSKLFNVC